MSPFSRLVRVTAFGVAWAAAGPLAWPQLPPGGGPLPAEALALPADLGLLLGFDAKALFGSAEYKLLLAGQALPGVRPADQAELRESLTQGLKELEAKTGINPERDLERVVAGFGDFAAKDPQLVVVALGRLDAARITSAFESGPAPGTTVERRAVGGRSLLLSKKAGKAEAALAFLSERSLVFGQAAVVEATLRSFVEARRPLETNAALMGLVSRLDPAASLFVVVGPAATASMRKGAGAQPPPFPIPDALSLASRFGGGFELVGEMLDEATARNMADLVRGGLAGLRMQLAQDKQVARSAEMNRLLDGIQVTVEGRRARLSAPGPTGGGAAVGLIAAVAIPSLLRARIAANEAAVIGDTRSVISAQSAGQLVGEKNGYKRAFHPGPAGRKPATQRSFAYTAAPVEPGKTGVRSFCGDSTGRICFDPKGAPIVPSAGACPQACTDLK